MSIRPMVIPIVMVGIILVASSTGFSQANVVCGLTAPLGPTLAAASTGHTEPIAAGFPAFVSGFEVSPPSPGGGILRVTCTNIGTTGTPGPATLTMNLGLPITNTVTFPAPATGIRIINPTGDFTSANVGINSIQFVAGSIAIALGTVQPSPASGIGFTAGLTSSFDLAGILVSTYGRSGPVAATLSASPGVYVTTGAVTVISLISAGIMDPTVPAIVPASTGLPAAGGTALITLGGTTLKENFTLRIQEAYPGMFRSASQFNGGGVFPNSLSSSTQIMFLFSNIPLGLGISNCSVALTDVVGNISGRSPLLSTSSVTTAAPILVADFVSAVSLSSIDVLWLSCHVDRGSAALPLPMTAVGVQVTLGPLGNALSVTGTPLTSLTTGSIPRYGQALQPAFSVPVILFPSDPPPPDPETLPLITAITPSSVGQGHSVNAVITGSNLAGAFYVIFSGMEVGVTIGTGGTATSLPVTIIVGRQAEPGARTVSVVTPNGASAPFSAFTVKTVGPMAWGSNGTGQLGHPNPATEWSPGPVDGLGTGSATIAIAAGTTHNLALKPDGTVVAWGNNASGQLGDGTVISRLSPVPVSAFGPGSGVVAVTAGNGFSLALKADGSVLGWGSNSSGQLGDGTTIARSSPALVNGFGPGSGVIAIAASRGAHALALKSDGTVWAWGLNTNGQVGDASTVTRLSPVQVHGSSNLGLLNNVAGIVAGATHSAAWKTDGSIVTWGGNTSGQLGDGTNIQRTTPFAVVGLGTGSGVLNAAAGNAHTLAVKSDGTIVAWGFNASGQLGDGTLVQRTAPVQVIDPSGFGFFSGAISVSAGNTYSLAVRSNGTVFGWGANSSGNLGNGTTLTTAAPVQTSLPPGEASWKISAGASSALALATSGAVLSWGSNSTGQLGNGTYDDTSTPGAIVALADDDMTFSVGIAAGANGSNNLLAKSDGRRVFTWGSSGSTPPVIVDIGFGPPIALATGASHNLALKFDGTVLAWGTNTNGQLGDGTTISRSVPHPVNALGAGSGVVAVAAGGSHSLALTFDGTVWAWGLNSSGQLGTGTTFQTTSPVAVIGAGSGIIAISAGASFSLALRNDGTVWAWGLNLNGQLGDAITTPTSLLPVQVHGLGNSGFLTGVTEIAAGGTHVLAAQSDGTILSWGSNGSGQLGDGTVIQKTTPVSVTGLGSGSNVVSLAAGSTHSLAMKSDGSVWSWGSNAAGQLGDGTFQSRLTPGPALVSDAIAIAAGSAHSLALGATLVTDKTPPLITPSISGTAGDNGWYRSSVTVTWTVQDPESSITSSTGCAPIVLTGDTAGITLECTAANAAGLAASASVRIKIDKTPPAVLLTRTAANGNGWNNGPVLIHFTATDSLSGISGAAFVDRNISSEGGNQSANATFIDAAGNSVTAIVDGINIDTTPPVISGMPAAACNVWPPNNKLVEIAAIKAVDVLSGVAPDSLSVTVTSNEPVDASDIVVAGGVVRVRADRSARGTGRVYTVAARAADSAGNLAFATGSCTVPHNQ